MSSWSGVTSIPAYVQEFHAEILQGDPATDGSGTPVDLGNFNIGYVLSELSTLGNPYQNAAIYDPESDLDQFEDRVNVFRDFWSGFDPLTLWTSYVEAATEAIDNINTTVDEIEDAVTEFTNKAVVDLARGYNRIASMLFEGNAVIGSTYPGALAVLESQYLTDVNKFRADLTLQARREKMNLVFQSVGQLSQLLSTGISTHQIDVDASLQLAKFRIAAKTDQLAGDLQYNVEELTWDLNLLKSGADAAGAISGIGGSQEKPSQMQSRLVGGMTGLALGASLGVVSGIPEVGFIAAPLFGMIGALAAAPGPLRQGMSNFLR